MRDIPSCPTCGKEHCEVVYNSTLQQNPSSMASFNPYSAHYQINRCTHCGLLRASPILDEEGVVKLYRDSSETNIAPGEETNVQRTMRRYYRLAQPFLDGRHRMLDVGCDRGFILEEAAKDGFKEVHGLEPNPAARQLAAHIKDAVLSDQFYEQTSYPSSSFDFMVMIHVLDHLVDPRVVLAKALCDLKPGGVMMAVVHNVESLLGRILGGRFPPFNLYHFYYFSKRTLGALFANHGFEVLKVVSTSNCYSLDFFASRAPGVPQVVRRMAAGVLKTSGLGRVPLTIPLGNIGIVARRPL
ncbi:MAG: class I SAM-dependent methyltransferase [Deltaproteobacteria bacterium]|nr:class I SAM-dependent methyltransferase [Deltaproteobacteria bacterium]